MRGHGLSVSLGLERCTVHIEENKTKPKKKKTQTKQNKKTEENPSTSTNLRLVGCWLAAGDPVMAPAALWLGAALSKCIKDK